MQVRERELSSNGLRHHVIEWGSPSEGPAVVLCHGFLDLAWGFRDLAERLATSGYHVFAFDWRGHGETDWIGPGGYYHFPDYVLDLHGLLPQLTERPCHLVGHSMGGSACTLFASSFGASLQSLALLEGLGPPAAPSGTSPRRLQTWVHSVNAVRAKPAKPMADLDDVMARVRRRTPDLPENLGRWLAEKATKPADGGGLLWRWDPMHRTPSPYGFDVARFKECIAAVDVPTLCVRGSRGMRTGDDAERYALLRDARLVEIDDCGHMLQWTHPGQVGDALQGFWAGLG